MVIDPNLLQQANDAGARLANAERDALLARADYHTAIRRMHLGGASLREIAQALSLSHQRVQQVVSAAGGSWWQVWRRRGLTPDAACTWCGRPPSEVEKLIAGPRVYICDACVQKAERAMKTAVRTGRARCSFCQKAPNDARPVLTGPPNICNDCLRTCREIIDSHPA